MSPRRSKGSSWPSRSLHSGYQARRVEQRELRQVFLIVTEGTETEPNYFNQFRSPTCEVEAVGIGCDPLTVVQAAVKRVAMAERAREPYDQVWCVFDRDTFPLARFREAFHLAHRHNLQVAYTNPAFEFWYLLHYQYRDTAIDRHECCDLLPMHLGCPYRKSDVTIFDKLKPHQAAAITRAKRLLASHSPLDPANNNPSTTVHLLVEALNENRRP